MVFIKGLGMAGLMILIALPVSAEIFKWTDEYGRVHYGDKPPTETAPEIKLKSQPGASDSATVPRVVNEDERREKQRKLIESFDADRRAKEQADAKRKEQQSVRQRNCNYARSELRTAQNSNLLYEYDQQGNKVYLNKHARNRYVNKWQTEVERWCD